MRIVSLVIIMHCIRAESCLRKIGKKFFYDSRNG